MATKVNIPFLLSADAFVRMEELFKRGYSLARIVGIGLYHASLAEQLPVGEANRQSDAPSVDTDNTQT